MFKHIAGIILFLHIFSVVHTQNDDMENTQYDIGCYKASKELNNGGNDEFMRKLREGATLPNCIQGGVWRNVQCKLSYCFCAYADTGNQNTEFNPSMRSYAQLKLTCPEEVEYKEDSCVAPPFNYNCNLGHEKFQYNPQSFQCEPAPFGCYGFSTVWECQKSCSPQDQNVIVEFDVDKRSDGRLSMPRWIITKYNLDLAFNQVNASQFFGFVENGAILLQLETRETPTTTTTTTTTKFIVNPVEGSTNEGCYEPAEVGPCKALIPRWYFNATESRCYGFIYGGCLSNENNFHTSDSCASYCGAQNPPTVRFNAASFTFDPIL